eukprot:CAMPEP_0185197514 /NCGR_PEP_ID=MMETSP1140-20130426/40566_1 /TAXON_ID=298111 /ORGANISM="Pavlova sp., Strain CCMP459" /LENGTH=40 /DNA_ID= /DNA_START= /DNA_END= /DNA_ORIENTATION=
MRAPRRCRKPEAAGAAASARAGAAKPSWSPDRRVAPIADL